MSASSPPPLPEFPEAARALLRGLAALPYENLSKIVAHHEAGPGRSREGALDFSASWLEDHLRTGLGGTCFALTHWLKLKLDALGFSTAYLMADKRIEANIHCGLVFERDGRAWLLDPGYLIFEPLPLPQGGLSVEAFLSPNAVRVEDVPHAGAWRLWTGPRGALKHRFDFRKEPVDAAEFQRHWEASYSWPMMNYPVLNRVKDGTQYYLQKDNLLVRTAEAGTMRKLTAIELRAAAVDVFGLPRGLVEEALGLLGINEGGQRSANS
jgi:arylamine N-acetyltransferase